jgi:Tfp pilus assembly protein PilX
MLAHRPRGSTLLSVLIVVLAITLLGVAVMLGSSRYLANARNREHNVGLANCAMAVRQYVAGQVTSGTPVTTLRFSIPAVDGGMAILAGHYENTPDGGTVTLAGAPPAFGVKSGASVQNIANAMPMTIGTGTTQQTGSAVCVDPDGRTYEVEFSYVGQ